jgi:hypothetical protein
MKSLVKRQCQRILLSVVLVWLVFAAFGLAIYWLGKLLDANFSISGNPIGLFFIVCVVTGYTEFLKEFNIAMQTGTSRRHILLSTLSVWGVTSLVTTVGILVYEQMVPHTPAFLQELGYLGRWDGRAQISEVLLVFAAFSFAALLGLSLQLLMLWVPSGWRALIFLLPLAIVLWLAMGKSAGPTTRLLANGFQTGAAAIPYLWPAIMVVLCLGLIGLDARMMRVVEPQV